jgi:hypothetical protein
VRLSLVLSILPETGLLSCVPLPTWVDRISSTLSYLVTVIPIDVSVGLVMEGRPPALIFLWVFLTWISVSTMTVSEVPLDCSVMLSDLDFFFILFVIQSILYVKKKNGPMTPQWKHDLLNFSSVYLIYGGAQGQFTQFTSFTTVLSFESSKIKDTRAHSGDDERC